MQLLYEYHELVEQDSNAVSGFWKAFQICIYMMASAFGIACTVFLHVLIIEFDMNCILFPKLIVFKNETDNLIPDDKPGYGNETAMVDFISSRWADMDECHIPLFNPIMAAILGIVWTVFFMMCSKGGKSLSGLIRPWRILVPAFVFTLVYGIFCFVVSHKTHDGLIEFLNLFDNATKTVEVDHYPGIKKIKAYVICCLATSWLYSGCWFFALLLILLRCCCVVDFKIMRVRVELIESPDDQNEATPKAENIAKKLIRPAVSPTTPDSPLSDDNSFAPLIERKTVAFKSSQPIFINEHDNNLPERRVKDRSDGDTLKNSAQSDNYGGGIPILIVQADVEKGAPISSV